MAQKESDRKLYRVYKDRYNRINTKENEDGRVAAIQFDKRNKLNGPVELEEVDVDDIFSSRTPREMNPYVQLILEQVVAPVIRYGFEVGTDKLLTYLSDKGILSAKQAIKKFAQNAKNNIQGVKDDLLGKETKASQILREATANKSTAIVASEKIDEQDFEKECRSQEEIQQVIDLLRKSVLVTATCIRILTNTIVTDGGADPEKLAVYKMQLEELGTAEVMNQINLMLEEKNRSLLDDTSYQVLSAFRQGNLIVDGETVPITHYIDCGDEQ